MLGTVIECLIWNGLAQECHRFDRVRGRGEDATELDCVPCLQQNVQVINCNSKNRFLSYLLNSNWISKNLYPFNYFLTLLFSDWNIQILCLRKFLTENMKWILKKKSQQIYLQVNRKEMFWVFLFVACYKGSNKLSMLVALCPLFFT